MGLRCTAAKMLGSVSTWGLRRLARRPAGNLPGKLALYVDPQLIAHLRGRIGEGSICVVGTNGKTTVTNLLADALEQAGRQVMCNRTGANLASGVATMMMQTRQAQWGVVECDELWLAKILPQLRADYVLLLNLFRDQLDRCGEIDRIQDSIVEAFASSPETVLIYNADDPLCAMVAKRADALPSRTGVRSVSFGVVDDMGLVQNVVNDATMCQRCSTMFEYVFRQYGQLGEYRCPNCGFSRPRLDWAAHEVSLSAEGMKFVLTEEAATIVAAQAAASDPGKVSASDPGKAARTFPLQAPFTGAYMVYNLTATATAASLLGCSPQAIQDAVCAFDPQNGRLQEYRLAGRRVLLNLAKNPTGFNQNLKIVAQDKQPKAVAFFINDKTADGHDISWIWDIDFEELAAQGDCAVFAGGIRKNDLQVRLKYAGVSARLIESIGEVFEILATSDEDTDLVDVESAVYAIANYTALPDVKADLDALASSDDKAFATLKAVSQSSRAHASQPQSPQPQQPLPPSQPQPQQPLPPSQPQPQQPSDAQISGALRRMQASSAQRDIARSPLVIAHMYPDLLNLYGDGGNVRVLSQRLSWRDIPVCVQKVCHGDTIDLAQVDLVFMGGGPDREQKLASEGLLAMREDIARFVEEGGPLLAICGGYQILGSVWLLGDEEVPGLSIVDIRTRRPGTSADRLIDNIVLRSSLAKHPVVGYENHAGRTYLGSGLASFGKLISSTGHGNNDDDKADGVIYRNVIGTYSHGPLLSKNPEVADYLLECACKRHAGRTGEDPFVLSALDDAEELAANVFMCRRLKLTDLSGSW